MGVKPLVSVGGVTRGHRTVESPDPVGVHYRVTKPPGSRRGVPGVITVSRVTEGRLPEPISSDRTAGTRGVSEVHVFGSRDGNHRPGVRDNSVV